MNSISFCEFEDTDLGQNGKISRYMVGSKVVSLGLEASVDHILKEIATSTNSTVPELLQEIADVCLEEHLARKIESVCNQWESEIVRFPGKSGV